MTPITQPPASPQSRLAASRKALVRQMSHDDSGGRHDASSDLDRTGDASPSDTQSGSGRSSAWQIFIQAMGAWWQHHPAHLAIDIGRPYLNNYARDKPLQLVGIAAVIGATAVLVKPWRLVSFTGIAVALLKSTKLSTTLLSLLPHFSSAPKTAAGQHPSTTPDNYNKP